MGMEFKDKLCCIASGKWNVSKFHFKDLILLHNGLGFSDSTHISGLMVSKSEFRCSQPGSFLGRGGTNQPLNVFEGSIEEIVGKEQKRF